MAESKDSTKRRPAKGRGKPKPRFDKRENVKDMKRDIHNDPSWYTVNGQLLKDVSSLSFNTALGSRSRLSSYSPNIASAAFTIPGVCSIMTVPSVGVTTNENDPVNIAAKNIYSFVRHANSGHSNYDPADLMIYLLAMDSIYTYWSYMVRIYGVANIYSQTNRYVGDAYIKSMGVNPDSIRSNLADLRAYINMFAVKASTMCVPRTMSYFVRHSWMYSNLYKDEDVSKSQVYMYVPAALYQFDLDSDGAGMLKAVNIAVNLNSGGGISASMRMLDFNNIVSTGNTLLNSMLRQEDIGIMSGDILKAYGKENLWVLTPIPENYGVLPVFSEEVLMQIHNTEFCGSAVGYISDAETGSVFTANIAGLNITQDTAVGSGILKFQPAFDNANHLVMDHLLDFWKEEVTPEMVMVATRNKANAIAGTGTSTVKLQSCGSEVTLFAFIGQFQNDGSYALNYIYANDANNFPVALTYFNEYPIRCVLNSTHSAVAGIYGEMDNYTVLNYGDLERINTVALLSMFGVPYIP